MNKQELIRLINLYQNQYGNDKHIDEILDFLSNNERFWQNDNEIGHVTASAWVLDKREQKAVLTHHKKLDKWFQLGGHIELEDNDIFEASKREVIEESGLNQLKLASKTIFDIDVHLIPVSKKGFPAHYHFDIRILFWGNTLEVISFDQSESKDVLWLSFDEIKEKNNDVSMLRMIEKSKHLIFN